MNYRKRRFKSRTGNWAWVFISFPTLTLLSLVIVSFNISINNILVSGRAQPSGANERETIFRHCKVYVIQTSANENITQISVNEKVKHIL
jgi:hypothetical protein